MDRSKMHLQLFTHILPNKQKRTHWIRYLSLKPIKMMVNMPAWKKKNNARSHCQTAKFLQQTNKNFLYVHCILFMYTYIHTKARAAQASRGDLSYIFFAPHAQPPINVNFYEIRISMRREKKNARVGEIVYISLPLSVQNADYIITIYIHFYDFANTGQ